MKRVYYNEFDPYAAQWLRNLIAAGHLPDGDVDERDIREVRADDVRGYTACHFFAGIGGWGLALELAGWPADRFVWTASLPCQPFSVAGKKKGEEDERHLWPVFFPFVKECRPDTIFGEQVASDDGLRWLDGVFTDLEAADYACGAADLAAAGAGSPQIRQRLFWVASSRSQRRERQQGAAKRRQPDRAASGRTQSADGSISVHEAGRCVASLHSERCKGRPQSDGTEEQSEQQASRRPDAGGCGGHNFWSSFDLVPCTDDEFRRIEPGTFPLVDGLPEDLVSVCPETGQETAPSRVGMLKGYGNAIVPELAALFIRAYMQAFEEPY